MKIFWLTENYPPQRGGMAVSCERIVRSLRETGVEIDTAHFSTRYLHRKSEQKLNGKHFSCPVEEDISHAINRLWNSVENENYTHIVSYGGLISMTASPVFARWMNIPLITLIRGNDFDAGIFSLKRADIVHRALENSAAICAVSRDKVKKISALYPHKKVVLTANGISLKDWEFSPEDMRAAENFRAANLQPGQKVLGLFGQLKRKKGGLFFLENLLYSDFAEKFYLLLVGEIDKETDDFLQAKQSQIAFRQLPFLDRYELLPHYAACDFVVIPSFYDGMPNVLLESAALGIPSISSNTGGMRDILTDGETSILFETSSDGSCRGAIEKAYSLAQGDYKNMQTNCIKLAEKFSPQAEAQNYLQIFNETADKKGIYAQS